MATLYLIDGSFELFRCFFGAPRAQRSDGKEIGAVRTLFGTTLALLREEALTHVAVAFDDVALLEAREPEDTELIQAQYDLAREVFAALGVTVWTMSGFSADDALATSAHRFDSDPSLTRIVICSSDNDFAQCVRGERIVLYNRIKRIILNEAAVLEKFGVPPERIPGWLALVGDKSDGIPGIPGFGPKAASAVLRRFGRLEDVPLEATAWEALDVRGSRKLAATFIERRQEAIGYRDQGIKRLDAPLGESLEELRWCGADGPGLEALARALENDGFLRRQIPLRGA
ncbi:MAG TPA: 5'-3' exonuclease H3TH domain-containing protein [Candidatus Latescibacteria bacterium]|jgi:5'-3' exonuclease|nr:flap endonuclease [Gemmatimonadaceae bacterium]MDP6014663.1 5'-3' exonuclease H3TH domain-containing protein [Candidatus Latescibacterota bacterium]HJP29266.1 5'-3' exonuclease H3TH domain-containing protein [Candidatus Latescibacterota bacterium]|tara:strand:- start:410 stop:1270 length:861 start_codon:yes stop_codon:yes gene_type:complete